MNPRAKEFYNQNFLDYDIHMGKTGHYLAQKELIQKILGLNQISRNLQDSHLIREPILDLACGSGFLIKVLSERFSQIFGNDFSEEMISLAKENNPKIAFTNENAEALTSYSKKFNTIICCNLFYYLTERISAIKRWKDLLEQNGKIVFIEEFPFRQPNSTEMNSHQKELMDLVHPLSPAEIIELMNRQGLLLTNKLSLPIDDYHKLYCLIFEKND